MSRKNLLPSFLKRPTVTVSLAMFFLLCIFLARDFFPLPSMSEKGARYVEDHNLQDPSSKNPVISTGLTESKILVNPRKEKIVEDILSMTPPKFFDNFKNPCWYSEKGNLQCLPYFQLIGVDKSGSSDFFDRIQKHPQIVGNTGVLGKETQWWCWKRYGLYLISGIKLETFEDYLKYFKPALPVINKTQDSNGYHNVITGDGTPMDLWDFRGWVQIPQNLHEAEPKILTPHLIHHLNPKTKFIIIMREPVDRLYSDFYFLDLARPFTPENFHVVVNKSVSLLKMCQRAHSLRYCLYDNSMHHKWDRWARIHLGFYSVYIEEWLKVFNKDQFLFFRTNEYSGSMKETLSQTFDFLGVEKLSDDMYQRLNMTTSKRKHVTKPKTNRLPMLPETRKILCDLYEPFNLQLANILGDKRYLFRDEGSLCA